MNQNKIEILVLEAKLGKQEAFNDLYMYFYKPMRRYAFVRTKDVMASEDIVQNVWIKITKRIHRLNDVTVFRSWLYKALIWEILDWHKKYSVTISPNKSEYDPDELTAQEEIDVASLIPLLQSLTTKEHDVVELYYLNDLTLVETSQVLDILEGTVKSRLFSAREKLRKKINQGE